ncbi:hypothetical protein VFPFJ_04191 [Purpureocillium lilacinum]|uniref:Uncharacterized protein n=1 Tax=Purpureocillium lilacinum TaxID=33203 RepID=A0A179HSB9_PURLI|nr:hypothetical protein VFPFJ_04191 [Purpureocillium lilacinum]OAQ82410.1 hypothetical protein VFPBJ_04994 [Purpureocillium lilacinum]OAQ92451.1 hypothetical protein VFPFJ_04191 [Purpureocillium lilacinum]
METRHETARCHHGIAPKNQGHGRSSNQRALFSCSSGLGAAKPLKEIISGGQPTDRSAGQLRRGRHHCRFPPHKAERLWPVMDQRLIVRADVFVTATAGQL